MAKNKICQEIEQYAICIKRKKYIKEQYFVEQMQVKNSTDVCKQCLSNDINDSLFLNNGTCLSFHYHINNTFDFLTGLVLFKLGFWFEISLFTVWYWVEPRKDTILEDLYNNQSRQVIKDVYS